MDVQAGWMACGEARPQEETDRPEHPDAVSRCGGEAVIGHIEDISAIGTGWPGSRAVRDARHRKAEDVAGLERHWRQHRGLAGGSITAAAGRSGGLSGQVEIRLTRHCDRRGRGGGAASHCQRRRSDAKYQTHFHTPLSGPARAVFHRPHFGLTPSMLGMLQIVVLRCLTLFLA